MEKNEVVNNLFEIETRSGEKINLTFNVVKTLFANGENITELEFRNFFQICKLRQIKQLLKGWSLLREMYSACFFSLCLIIRTCL